MPAILRLNIKEANDLASQIESKGGNADSLKAAIKEVNNSKNSHSSIPASDIGDEEYLEEMYSKSPVEHGTNLECMMCHEKFDHLICGVCEVCFRGWMLPLKPKSVTKRML